MHTAQHLLTHCLSGELAQDRTIILVTHHVSLCLPVAAYLVELALGQVLHQGTIEELRAAGLLQQVVEDEDESISDDETRLATPENEADKLSQDHVDAHARMKKGKLVDEEARAEGRVSLRTYLTYIRAAGTWSFITTLFLMILIRGINTLNQVTISFAMRTIRVLTFPLSST